MSIRTVIVDDEELAREGIALRLAEHPDFTLMQACPDGRKAVRAIRELGPDLVFLDVQMPGMSGLDVLSEVGPEQMPITVFVTAFERHAIAAFEAQALDYLLKPIDDQRFITVLQRVRETVHQQAVVQAAKSMRSLLDRLNVPASSAPSRAGTSGQTLGDAWQEDKPAQQGWAQRLVGRSRGRTRIVQVAEIRWLEADDDYVRLHLNSGHVLLRETLTSLVARLDPSCFARSHKRFAVRLDLVSELRPTSSGDHQVLLSDGTVLRLSRSFRSAFEKALSAVG